MKWILALLLGLWAISAQAQQNWSRESVCTNPVGYSPIDCTAQGARALNSGVQWIWAGIDNANHQTSFWDAPATILGTPVAGSGYPYTGTASNDSIREFLGSNTSFPYLTKKGGDYLQWFDLSYNGPGCTGNSCALNITQTSVDGSSGNYFGGPGGVAPACTMSVSGDYPGLLQFIPSDLHDGGSGGGTQDSKYPPTWTYHIIEFNNATSNTDCSGLSRAVVRYTEDSTAPVKIYINNSYSRTWTCDVVLSEFYDGINLTGYSEPISASTGESLIETGAFSESYWYARNCSGMGLSQSTDLGRIGWAQWCKASTTSCHHNGSNLPSPDTYGLTFLPNVDGYFWKVSGNGNPANCDLTNTCWGGFAPSSTSDIFTTSRPQNWQFSTNLIQWDGSTTLDLYGLSDYYLDWPF